MSNTFQHFLFFFCLVWPSLEKKKKSQLRLIKLVGVSQDLCAVCVCALMQVFFLSVGCGPALHCTCGASEGDVMIGGRVSRPA